MSHLNYMWLSEHINEYNSVDLYKYVWIHPILHCFLLNGWMLLVTAAFPLHNPTWGVWLAASGPFSATPRQWSWAADLYTSVGTYFPPVSVLGCHWSSTPTSRTTKHLMHWFCQSWADSAVTCTPDTLTNPWGPWDPAHLIQLFTCCLWLSVKQLKVLC